MAAEGSDFSGQLDLDPALRLVSGRRALSEAIYRRLTTPTGSIPDWPAYGYDLRSALGTAQQDATIRQAIAQQLADEEELDDYRITLKRVGNNLEILIQLIDGDGPFDLTISVDEVTVTAIIPAEI